MGLTREDEDEIRESWREGLALLRILVAERFGNYDYAMRDMARTDLFDTRIRESVAKSRDCRETLGLRDPRPAPPPYEPGYVYVLHADNHLFKIGKSKHITSRVETIGLIVPMTIKHIGAVYTDSMTLHERHLHVLFCHRRVKGEWFRLSFWDLVHILQSETCLYHMPHLNPQLGEALAEIAWDSGFEKRTDKDAFYTETPW